MMHTSSVEVVHAGPLHARATQMQQTKRDTTYLQCAHGSGAVPVPAHQAAKTETQAVRTPAGNTCLAFNTTAGAGRSSKAHCVHDCIQRSGCATTHRIHLVRCAEEAVCSRKTVHRM
jgi:hypothetical protein